jgi:tetratricopeptide (TPR) repeat protein
VLAHEPLGGPASARLKELCRADGDFKRLLELLHGELEVTTDRSTRGRLMMEIAQLHRDKLGDPEAAALVLHDLLQADPQHRKALAAYEDYFRQKGDYRNLAELLRYAAQSSREAGAAPMEVCARLEELADACEQRLGDIDGAIEAWQQIAEIHPDRQRADDALRRLHAKRRMWHKTVEALQHELKQAVSPQERLEVLRRMAQVYYDKQIDPIRLSDLLLEILQQDPRDERALRMLVDVCERESDHEGLASTLRLQLDGIVTKTERVRLLRRLATLYAEQLDRPSDAIAAYREILAATPPDTDALAKLQELLDANDELDQLTALLQQRLDAASGEDERNTALVALARLMDTRLEAPSRALEYWEQVLALAPDDAEALTALTRLYHRGNQPEKLLELLLTEKAQNKPSSPARRVELLQQIAHAADQLDRTDIALTANEELADLLPASRQALDALARIYAQLSREEDLVRVLGRAVGLSEDREERVALAFKRVDIMEDKLGDLDAAVAIYRQIIDDIAPGDLDAHRRLKLLHVRRNDYSRAAEIAEREFFLTPEDESGLADRRQLALEIAQFWWEHVQDPQRAQLAFERALELAPDRILRAADRSRPSAVRRPRGRPGASGTADGDGPGLRGKALRPASRLRVVSPGSRPRPRGLRAFRGAETDRPALRAVGGALLGLS